MRVGVGVEVGGGVTSSGGFARAWRVSFFSSGHASSCAVRAAMRAWLGVGVGIRVRVGVRVRVPPP